MIRGTTALHTFKFKESVLSNCLNVLITYRQNGETILERQLNEVEVGNDILSVRFSQQETLMFEQGIAYTQLKVFTSDKKVLSSAEFSFPVTSTLNSKIFLDDGSVVSEEEFETFDFYKIVRGEEFSVSYTPTVGSVEDILSIKLILKQCFETVIEKQMSDAEIINNTTYKWTLTPQETLSLSPRSLIRVECYWKTNEDIKNKSLLMLCQVSNKEVNDGE